MRWSQELLEGGTAAPTGPDQRRRPNGYRGSAANPSCAAWTFAHCRSADVVHGSVERPSERGGAVESAAAAVSGVCEVRVYSSGCAPRPHASLPSCNVTAWDWCSARLPAGPALQCSGRCTGQPSAPRHALQGSEEQQSDAARLPGIADGEESKCSWAKTATRPSPQRRLTEEQPGVAAAGDSER